MFININKHIPKAGGLNDFWDRLSAYVSAYDKSWLTRIQPIYPHKMKYLEDLLLNTAKINEIPVFYKIFLEHLGNNDGKLIFWNEPGSVGRIFAENGMLFSEKEKYHADDDDEHHFSDEYDEYDPNDDPNRIPKLLEISCDDYNYIYDCLDLSMEEPNVVDECGQFISENFEKYIFQSIFCHYFIKYKSMPFIIHITQSGSCYKEALAELKINCMFEFVDQFAKDNSFAKIWFSDKAHCEKMKASLYLYENKKVKDLYVNGKEP